MGRIFQTMMLVSAFALMPHIAAADQITTTLDERFSASELHKGDVSIVNGARENLNVGVVSWRDLPFQTVKRQALDFSCGSATVATMMTYVYGKPVTEKEVFLAMFEKGDQEKIRKEGFSMLDMSDFMNSKGLKTSGYRLDLASIQKKRVPFIALINKQGYNHFVVVKGIAGPFVLVGDPNNGNVVYSRKEFQAMWNGIALVATNEARKARAAFNNPGEWKMVRATAFRRALQDSMDSDALEPIEWQIAPASLDLLQLTMDTTETAQDMTMGNTIDMSTTTGNGL